MLRHARQASRDEIVQALSLLSFTGVKGHATICTRGEEIEANLTCTYVRTYVRTRPTATLRMRERCSNSADLAGFRNQLLFVSGPGMSWGRTRG